MADGSIFQLTNPEIYVLTTAHNGQRAGQVVTWVTLASLIPENPRVVVVLSPCTYTSSVLSQSQRFVLNMLASDQSDWLERFGMVSGHTQDKFQGIEVTTAEMELPILPGTCGWASCRVSEQIDQGDRVIWVADVFAQSFNPTKQPLRRMEGLGALSEPVRQTLIQQRLADIERDRAMGG